MKYFKVTSRFYNDGKVECFSTEIEAEKLPTNIHISKEKYDYYEDYFANKKEADSMVQDAYSEMPCPN